MRACVRACVRACGSAWASVRAACARWTVCWFRLEGALAWCLGGMRRVASSLGASLPQGSARGVLSRMVHGLAA
eukprot:6116811-Alexandrium_andersonii.AAC.1